MLVDLSCNEVVPQEDDFPSDNKDGGRDSGDSGSDGEIGSYFYDDTFNGEDGDGGSAFSSLDPEVSDSSSDSSTPSVEYDAKK